MVKEIEISRPDDWHLHLRDGDLLPITVNETAKSLAKKILVQEHKLYPKAIRKVFSL